MKKNRYIPFGYTMQNGGIILHERKAPAVKIIYSSYLASASLQAIAETLQAQGPVYNEGKSWNKHMVKRIIEDRRYLGGSGYPPLISAGDYDQANQIKADKNTYIPIPIPQAVKALKGKAFCAECGSAFVRRSDSRYGERWLCKNSDCKTDYKITDRHLLDAAVSILNTAIADPALLGTPASDADHTSSLEITRLQNEMNRELDKTEIDINAVKALIFACAAEKYIHCPEQSIPLQAEFNGRQPMRELSASFFDRTVQRLLIAKDGAVSLQMINHNLLSFHERNTRSA